MLRCYFEHWSLSFSPGYARGFSFAHNPVAGSSLLRCSFERRVYLICAQQGAWPQVPPFPPIHRPSCVSGFYFQNLRLENPLRDNGGMIIEWSGSGSGTGSTGFGGSITCTGRELITFAVLAKPAQVSPAYHQKSQRRLRRAVDEHKAQRLSRLEAACSMANLRCSRLP